MTKVKIYTTPSCTWCKRTKDFFKEHNVEYEEFNVASDGKARQEIVQKSGQLGVPVTIIGNKVIVGFDEPALKSALGIK